MMQRRDFALHCCGFEEYEDELSLCQLCGDDVTGQFDEFFEEPYVYLKYYGGDTANIKDLTITVCRSCRYLIGEIKFPESMSAGLIVTTLRWIVHKKRAEYYDYWQEHLYRRHMSKVLQEIDPSELVKISNEVKDFRPNCQTEVLPGS